MKDSYRKRTVTFFTFLPIIEKQEQRFLRNPVEYDAAAT